MGITLRDGQHEGIVAKAIFQTVQTKLNAKPIVPAKANTDKEFVLRGAVTCSDCGWKLTSCWSKGATKRYAYYICQNRACESRGKSTARHKLEAQVDDLLRTLQPSQLLAKAGMALFKQAWDCMELSIIAQKRSYTDKIKAAQE